MLVRTDVPIALAGRTIHNDYDDTSGYFGWGCLLDDGTSVICRENATQWHMDRCYMPDNGATWIIEELESTGDGIKLYRPRPVVGANSFIYCRGGYENSEDYSADLCLMNIV